MKTILTALFLSGAALAASGCATCPTCVAEPAGATEHRAVIDANDAFYEAMDAMFDGDMGPMEDIWSDNEPVTYINPAGEIVVGHEDIMKDWRSQARQKLGGSIEPRDIHVFAEKGGNLAVVQNFEHARGQRIDGKLMNITIRATNVYRREGGKWKMVSHAVDPIPALHDAP